MARDSAEDRDKSINGIFIIALASSSLVALHAGLGRLGAAFAALLLREIRVRLGRRGVQFRLLFAALDFLVAQFIGHGENTSLLGAQRLRIRLMTVLSTRFKAACSALVAGPRGFGLGLSLGVTGGLLLGA